jgi:hypothetical protein
MAEKVVPIWLSAVEAAVELLWENRVEGDELEASWDLLEPYGPEAIEKGKELYKEREAKAASLKNPKTQPSVEEPKPTPKPAEVEPNKAGVVASAGAKPWIRQFPKPVAAPKRVVAAPALKRGGAGRKYGWDEVVVPKGVSDIEALTYVPGLVGQTVEWIVSGARRPNRVMALGVALTVVGTLQGRLVEGPTGNATHLYVFILAPTGWGKDHPLWCGNKLMIEVGHKGLLGPSEFVSGRGIIKYLKRQPLVLCIVDELGELFMLVNSQGPNAFVRDILGQFKKLYNSWGLINTAESVPDESVTINHPAVSIVGACTPQAFFEALTPIDIEGGFAKERCSYRSRALGVHRSGMFQPEQMNHQRG